MAEFKPIRSKDQSGSSSTFTPILSNDQSSDAVEDDRNFLEKTVDVGQNAVSVLGDVGKGALSGGVNIAQGLSELPAAGIDAVYGTNLSRPVTNFFDAVKENELYNIKPEGMAGGAAEGIVTFGGAFIPIAGWLGRANTVAKGVKVLPGTSRFARSAEAFGRSKTGKIALGNRAKQIAATAVTTGVVDGFIAPSTMSTLSDSFDALPDFTKTEEDTGLIGREEGRRRLRNKGKFFVEGVTLGGAFELGVPIAGAIGRSLGKAPDWTGIPLATRSLYNAIDKAGDVLGDLPLPGPLKKHSKILKRLFTTAGLTDRGLYEGLETIEGVTDQLTKSGSRRFKLADKAMRKAVGKQVGVFGKKKEALVLAREDMLSFLKGDHLSEGAPNPMLKYGSETVKRAQEARDQIDRVTDIFIREIENAPIPPAKKGQLVTDFEAMKGKYLRNIYEVHSNPNFRMDGSFRSPAYNEVESFLSQGKDAKNSSPEAIRAEAESIVDNIYTENGVGDISDIISAHNEGFKTARNKGSETSLYTIHQGLLKSKSPLLEASPSLQKAMGKVNDPEEIYYRTLAQMAETVTANQAYAKYKSANGLDAKLLTGEDMSAYLNSGARPLVVDEVSEDAGKVLASQGWVKLDFNKEQLARKGKRQIVESLTKNLKASLKARFKGPPEDFKLTKPQLEGIDKAVAKQYEEGIKNKLPGYVKVADETLAEEAFGGPFGRMTGSWVPPESYKALTTTMRNQNLMQEAWAMSLQAKALSQISKTVLNPIAQIRNFYSGSFMLGANGLLGRDFDAIDSARITIGKIADLDQPELARELDFLQRSGTVDQNYVVNEYQKLLAQSRELKMAGGINKVAKKVLESAPFTPVNALLKGAQATYAGGDNFWKTAAYMGEKARYGAAFRKAGINPDDVTDMKDIAKSLGGTLNKGGVEKKFPLFVPRVDEITGEMNPLSVIASDIVKETMPTYSKVSEAVKNLRKIPITGNFMAFPAEMIRTSANITTRGLAEMGFEASDELIEALTRRSNGDAQMGATKARELEKQIRAIGAQRLTSFLTSSFMFKQGVVKAANTMLQVSDEEYDAMTESLPWYMDGHTPMVVSYDKKGKMSVIDLTYMLPYEVWQTPVQAGLQQYSRTGKVTDSEVEKIYSGAIAGLSKFLEPFAGEALVSERIVDLTLRGGKTKRGSIVVIDDDSSSDKFRKRVNHILGGFNPGLTEAFIKERRGEFEQGKLTRALLGTPTSYGDEVTTTEELTSIITGFREIDVDLPKNFFWRGREYNGSRREIQARFRDEANRNDSTKASVIESYIKQNIALQKAQSLLYSRIQNARALKTSERDIKRNLVKRAGLSESEVSLIMKGQFVPLAVTKNLQEGVRQESRRGEARVITRLPARDLNNIRKRLFRNPLQIIKKQTGEGDTSFTPVPSSSTFTPIRSKDQSGPSIFSPIRSKDQSVEPQSSLSTPSNIQVSQASSVPLSPSLLGDSRNIDIANRLGRA